MELQSTDPWEVAYRELADETSSGLFPERRVFDVNVENWKVTYEESPDDLTVKQYLQMRLAAVVRLTSDLGPARVISTPSQTESRTEIKVDEDDWIETCKRFARSFCSITVGDLANGEISLEHAQENMAAILQTVANIRAEIQDAEATDEGPPVS